MMRDYYKQYERIIRSKICQEVGISFRELGLDNVCLSYTPGKCRRREDEPPKGKRGETKAGATNM